MATPTATAAADVAGVPGIRRIGLTGGIGSGKSTVARLLAGHGACIVDTDAIARALTAPGGAALPAIATTFGADFIGADGALDRARMRTLAFADADALRRLEALLHPLIGAEAEAQAAQAARAASGAQAGERPVVFDVPLLTESGHWRARVDRVLVVDCPAPLQVARVVARSGWTADAVERVIARQATRAQRRAIADAVIDNGESTTPAALAAAVDALAAAWFAR